MNQYLYRIQPTRPELLVSGATAREQEIIGQHFEYLQSLHATGQLMLAGRTQDPEPTGFGLVIFQAENDEQAARIMSDDPAVRAGVFAAELFHYSIALQGNFPDAET